MVGAGAAAFANAFAVVVAIAEAGAFAGAGPGAFAVVVAFAGAGALDVAFAAHQAFILGRAGAVAAAGTAAVAFFAPPVIEGTAGTAAIASAIAADAVVADFVFFVLVVKLSTMIAIKQRKQGAFLSLFLLAMMVACLGAAELLPNVAVKWAIVAPAELGGWWPYLLALVDACLAVSSSRSLR